MVETELLLEIAQKWGFYYHWHKIPTMLHPYALPLAASIDESVYVTQTESCNVNFQMFCYVYEADGQWFLAAADDRLLLSCTLASLLLSLTVNLSCLLFVNSFLEKLWNYYTLCKHQRRIDSN